MVKQVMLEEVAWLLAERGRPAAPRRGAVDKSRTLRLNLPHAAAKGSDEFCRAAGPPTSPTNTLSSVTRLTCRRSPDL